MGSNEGLIFSKDSKSNEYISWQPSGFREIRDLAVLGDKIIGMASGDTSALLIYNRESHELEETIRLNGVFLDGMDVYDNELFIMGDPVNEEFSLFTFTLSEGLKKMTNIPKVFKGEAGYAASGSTVHFLENGDKIFVSGGMKSRIFKQIKGDSNWTIYNLPFKSGASSIPTHCLVNLKRWVVVGGDYFGPQIQQMVMAIILMTKEKRGKNVKR